MPPGTWSGSRDGDRDGNQRAELPWSPAIVGRPGASAAALHPLLRLQGTAGNAAVVGLLRQADGSGGPGPAVGTVLGPVQREVGPAVGVGALGRLGDPRPAEGTRQSSPSPTRSPVVQRFEAQHHEHIERGTLTAPSPTTGGFTDAEAGAVYFGNWSRDLSQALLNHPIIRTLGQEAVFELVNLIAMQKFGGC